MGSEQVLRGVGGIRKADYSLAPKGPRRVVWVSQGLSDSSGNVGADLSKRTNPMGLRRLEGNPTPTYRLTDSNPAGGLHLK